MSRKTKNKHLSDTVSPTFHLSTETWWQIFKCKKGWNGVKKLSEHQFWFKGIREDGLAFIYFSWQTLKGGNNIKYTFTIWTTIVKVYIMLLPPFNLLC